MGAAAAFSSGTEAANGVKVAVIEKGKIASWQQRFRAGTQVWQVVVGGDSEPTGNLYDSKEAAECEVSWRSARGQRAQVQSLGNLHTLELARERWA